MFCGDIFSVTPNDSPCFEEKKSKCGIVGIASMDTVAPLLMASLSRLEYQGYDSCGAATFSADGIEVRKDIGAVSAVIAFPLKLILRFSPTYSKKPISLAPQSKRPLQRLPPTTGEGARTLRLDHKRHGRGPCSGWAGGRAVFRRGQGTRGRGNPPPKGLSLDCTAPAPRCRSIAGV